MGYIQDKFEEAAEWVEENTLGGQLLNDPLGTQASKEALAAQTEAAGAAAQVQKEIYEQQREDLRPWRESGARALSGIEGNEFMEGWDQDPGYEFRMSEGLKAINASASAGGRSGGGTMKALSRYGQGLASQEYQNVYNRRYGRLADLAGIGQQATGQTVGIAGQYGQQTTDRITGLANAQAGMLMGNQAYKRDLIGSGIGATATYAGLAAK